MKKNKKTNVMRVLDSYGVEYEGHFNIDVDDSAGRKRLRAQGNVFKTLVTISKSNDLYVFVIPLDESLDLKKAALVSNEKNLTMLPQKDLLKYTGYMHGGCSPIGMKKEYRSFIDNSAKNFEFIAISGGKVGTQVEIASDDLLKVISFEYADLIK